MLQHACRATAGNSRQQPGQSLRATKGDEARPDMFFTEWFPVAASRAES
jgi:hypothetical protein